MAVKRRRESVIETQRESIEQQPKTLSQVNVVPVVAVDPISVNEVFAASYHAERANGSDHDQAWDHAERQHPKIVRMGLTSLRRVRPGTRFARPELDTK